MNYYVCRAMMIGMMNAKEIQDVQARENQIGRGLMPSELLEITGKQSIKNHYGINDDPDDQKAHGDRIDANIKRNKLLNTESHGMVCALNPDTLHEFDWNIYHNLDALDLDFQNHSKSKFRDLLKAVPAVLWISHLLK